MKNQSSNEIERAIEQLASIQPVAAPEGLYDKIQKKIQENNMVSWHWIRLAAAVLVGCLLVDGYVLLSIDSSTDIPSSESIAVFLSESNQLYHE